MPNQKGQKATPLSNPPTSSNTHEALSKLVQRAKATLKGQYEGQEHEMVFKQEYIGTWANNPVAESMLDNLRMYFDGIPAHLSSVNVNETMDIYEVGVVIPISKALYDVRIRKDQPLETVTKAKMLSILNAMPGGILDAKIIYDDDELLIICITFLANILGEDAMYAGLQELRGLRDGYRIEGYKAVEYSIRMQEIVGELIE